VLSCYFSRYRNPFTSFANCYGFLRKQKLLIVMLVFWFLMPCRLVGKYQPFRGKYCFREAACSSETSVSAWKSIVCYNPEVKRWYLHHHANLESRIGHWQFIIPFCVHSHSLDTVCTVYLYIIYSLMSVCLFCLCKVFSDWIKLRNAVHTYISDRNRCS
jgi:hypothetical protein